MYKSATVSQNLTLTAIMKRSFNLEQGVLVFFALAAHLCSSAHIHQDLDQALELDARESEVQVDATVEVNVKTPSPSSPNPPANPPANPPTDAPPNTKPVASKAESAPTGSSSGTTALMAKLVTHRNNGGEIRNDTKCLYTHSF